MISSFFMMKEAFFDVNAAFLMISVDFKAYHLNNPFGHSFF